MTQTPSGATHVSGDKRYYRRVDKWWFVWRDDAWWPVSGNPCVTVSPLR